MTPHPPSHTPSHTPSHPTPTAARAGRALLALLLTPTLTTLPGSGPAHAAGHQPRARTVVTAVDAVPAKLTAGQTFVGRVKIRTTSRTRPRPVAIVLRLSTDARAGRTDPVIGRARSSAPAPGRTDRVRVRATLPAQTAPGRYRVLACAAGRCTPAAGALRVVEGPRPPAATEGLRGTLTGDLHLVDEGELVDGPNSDRWQYGAHVSVQMTVAGADPASATFVSTGSQYRLTGTRTWQSPVGSCHQVVEEVRAGEGRLAGDGDPYRDDIAANVARLDLSALSMRIELGYEHTVHETLTGDDVSCSVDTVQSTRALDIEVLQLSQVGRTASTVTYAVSALHGPQGTTSDWDRVDGTLTLDRS